LGHLHPRQRALVARSLALRDREPRLPPLAPHVGGRGPRQELRRPLPVPRRPLRDSPSAGRAAAAALRPARRGGAGGPPGPAPLPVPPGRGLTARLAAIPRAAR